MGSFAAPQDGAYTIAIADGGGLNGSTVSGMDLAVSKGPALFSSSNLASFGFALLLGAVSALVGVVLLVVGLIRRSRWRRAQMALLAPTWMPPTPGPYGAQPGGAPYGAQPGGAPYGAQPGGAPYGAQPGGAPYGAQPARARPMALNRIRHPSTRRHGARPPAPRPGLRARRRRRPRARCRPRPVLRGPHPPHPPRLVRRGPHRRDRRPVDPACLHQAWPPLRGRRPRRRPSPRVPPPPPVSPRPRPRPSPLRAGTRRVARPGDDSDR